MNHQVMISFDVDDKKIQENIERTATQEAAKKIVQDVFGKEHYAYTTTLRKYTKELLDEILREEKEQIINRAVKEAVESIKRTKAFKDKLQEEIDAS